MLKEHLYVEGTLRVDRHSVRVLTDDDEVELAYFFVDDHVVASEPDRWAYLLHEDWELPLSAHPAREAFTPPVPVDVLTPAPPGGEGVTYAVLITFQATCNSVGGSWPGAFPGVRLPGLAAALRAADPGALSYELCALRALIASGDEELGPALERCVWAAAHPDLAASLMRFGAHWDPRCRREHSRLTHCG